jgi:hypothetical protein
MRNQNALKKNFAALLEDYRENGTENSRDAILQLIEDHSLLLQRLKELEDLRSQEKFLKSQAESWRNQCERLLERLD